mmetsp:Transcript_19499/g.31897  ORF Transcript_19499/g.31897 Transcript_19499/m.31897 type:complete len:221 (-) Transcript_19499:93-755(-)
MTDVAEWAEFALKTRDFYGQNRFYGEPLVTHTVSKTFSGKYRNDIQETICVDPKDCLHMHFPGSFDCDSLVSHDCDSEFSRDVLQGALSASYAATFGHAGDVPFAEKIEETHEMRGFYFGNFGLINRRGERFVDGALDGMINVGTVRDPLQKNCEKCHMVGRWHGRVMTSVQIDKEETALLVGTMAFDVYYELTTSWFGTKFYGTLEGMLIRNCQKEKKR